MLARFRGRSQTAAAVEPQPSKKWSLRLEKPTSSVAPPGVWSNLDLDPTLPPMWTWGKVMYIAYWASDIINVTGWQKTSAIISVGLDWRNALGIVALGCFIVSVPLVLNGAIGARYRIPFPIIARASFGYWFSFFAVIIRVILAFFWTGIQGWNGGTCIKILLGALFPSYARIPNHLPKSAGFTTQTALSYFIYWCIQLPCLFIHPRHLRPLLYYKAIATPICGLATMGWCVHRAGGSGPIFSQRSKLEGSAFSSAWLVAFTAQGFSSITVNVPDFTRYAKSPNAQWVQLPALPILYLLTAVLGVVSASATTVFNKTTLWSPLDIAMLWDSRAARVFAAGTWLVSQITSNVTSNTISAANDLCTLFPQYVNIRRGQILTALIGGWAMVPWKILASASIFLRFMNTWNIFLAPFAALLVTDYFLIKKQRLSVPDLYDPHGRYRYTFFGNWRALVALLASVGPNFPGLVNSLNTSINVGNIIWIYRLNWVFGYTVTSVVYYALCKIWPHADSLVSVEEAETFVHHHGEEDSIGDVKESATAEAKHAV